MSSDTFRKSRGVVPLDAIPTALAYTCRDMPRNIPHHRHLNVLRTIFLLLTTYMRCYILSRALARNTTNNDRRHVGSGGSIISDRVNSAHQCEYNLLWSIYRFYLVQVASRSYLGWRTVSKRELWIGLPRRWLSRHRVLNILVKWYARPNLMKYIKYYILFITFRWNNAHSTSGLWCIQLRGLCMRSETASPCSYYGRRLGTHDTTFRTFCEGRPNLAEISDRRTASEFGRRCITVLHHRASSPW